jgi:hypothetical protein
VGGVWQPGVPNGSLEVRRGELMIFRKLTPNSTFPVQCVEPSFLLLIIINWYFEVHV